MSDNSAENEAETETENEFQFAEKLKFKVSSANVTVNADAMEIKQNTTLFQKEKYTQTIHIPYSEIKSIYVKSYLSIPMIIFAILFFVIVLMYGNYWFLILAGAFFLTSYGEKIFIERTNAEKVIITAGILDDDKTKRMCSLLEKEKSDKYSYSITNNPKNYHLVGPIALAFVIIASIVSCNIKNKSKNVDNQVNTEYKKNDGENKLSEVYGLKWGAHPAEVIAAMQEKGWTTNGQLNHSDSDMYSCGFRKENATYAGLDFDSVSVTFYHSDPFDEDPRDEDYNRYLLVDVYFYKYFYASDNFNDVDNANYMKVVNSIADKYNLTELKSDYPNLQKNYSDNGSVFFIYTHESPNGGTDVSFDFVNKEFEWDDEQAVKDKEKSEKEAKEPDQESIDNEI